LIYQYGCTSLSVGVCNKEKIMVAEMGWLRRIMRVSKTRYEVKS